MSDTGRNRQTIHRFFEAFRHGDLNALDDLVAVDYAQHNPQARDGLVGLKEFLTSTGPLDVEIHRIVAEGDLVAVHAHLKTWNMAAVDIFRFGDDGRIVEHWDVLQAVPEHTVSGHDMFAQATA